MANNIFASRYVSYIPKKEQLIAQVEAVLKDWHEKEKNKQLAGESEKTENSHFL